MKNLRLSVKVGILVAVLLATTATVAVVGLRQLAQLEKQFNAMTVTGRQLVLISEAHLSLLGAIRAEKNAIAAQDKELATHFAKLAKGELDELHDLLGQLAKSTSGDATAASEQPMIADLNRSYDDFEKNQAEVLRLAVLTTDTEARAILNNDIYQRAHDLEELLASLAEFESETPATAPSSNARVSAKVAAGQQLLGRMYDLMFHLGVHISTATEAGMLKLDDEIKTRLTAYQESLRRFSAMLSDSERARGLTVLSSLETIKAQTARVQELSHISSDHYAEQLTMTRTVELANKFTAQFNAITKLVMDRRDDQSKDVSDQALIGRSVVITATIIGSILSLLLAILIIRSIARPVGDGVKVFEAIAAGDLTRRLKLDRHDEIGRLGAASDQMAGALCDVVTQIRSVAARLGESAGDLSGVSGDLLAQSQQMTVQAESVAAGTEEMSTNVSTMAAAAEQMSVNVSGISSASEEVSVNVASIVVSADATTRSVGSVAESIGRITASLQEVARDARHGSSMTQQARDMATGATAAMRQLDQAASEITKVTDVIKSIALQTNLLALNATIEATSAGEAGKGFAVVAGEVKELASQSARSAEEIARKIESVQTSTRDAVTVIENVAQFVEQVNQTAGRISDAVNGQTQTAGHIVAAVDEARHNVESIARSIAEVAKGATDVSANTSEASAAATDVSRNAGEAAKAAETISSNIHGVSQATRSNSSNAVRVNEAAMQLKEIAAQLQQSVSRFKVD